MKVDSKRDSLVQHGYGAVLTRSVYFAVWNYLGGETATPAKGGTHAWTGNVSMFTM